MILYLIQLIHPDLYIVTRELSKATKRSSSENFKILIRFIKYLVHSKDKGLCLDTSDKNGPIEEDKMMVYVDSDWEGDPETRQSVSGWIIMISHCPVGWVSRGQKMSPSDLRVLKMWL